MRLTRIPTETGAILYDPSRIDHPSVADFDPDALATAGRVSATATGRGSAWFVVPPAPGGDGLVLRHYRRGGLVARLVADRYLWRGEDATRPFRELRLLAEIEDLGLPAARPAAARYVRSGLGYRADLLTVAIPGARSLAAALAAGPEAAVWRRIGSTLRAFHDAGVRHADLNAHNVLLDREGGIHLVDFDRGRREAAGRWTEGNLARLARSLDKLRAFDGPATASPQWASLRDGYDAPRSAPPR